MQQVEDQVVHIQPFSKSQAIFWKDVFDHRQVFKAMVIRNWKLQFQTKYLSYLWPIAQPLMVTIAFMFLRRATNASPDVAIPFPLYLFSGLVLWYYFVRVTTEVSASLRREAGVIKKIFFPRILIPAVPVAQNLMNFAVAAIPTLLLMIYFQVLPSWNIFLLPFVILQVMALCFGIGCIWAAVTLIAEDLDQVLGLLLYVALFVSPVMFAPTGRSSVIDRLLSLNPMSGSLMAFRSTLFADIPFPWMSFGYSLVFSAVALQLGIRTFRRMENDMVDNL